MRLLINTNAFKRSNYQDFAKILLGRTQISKDIPNRSKICSNAQQENMLKLCFYLLGFKGSSYIWTDSPISPYICLIKHILLYYKYSFHLKEKHSFSPVAICLIFFSLKIIRSFKNVRILLQLNGIIVI